VTASYDVPAPAGVWSKADNGTYTVSLLPDQVRDTAGTALEPGILTTFAVRPFGLLSLPIA
jgi:hypothetical protein